jgi:hypothetical protein
MTNGGQHMPENKSQSGGKIAPAPTKEGKASQKPRQAKK